MHIPRPALPAAHPHATRCRKPPAQREARSDPGRNPAPCPMRRGAGPAPSPPAPLLPGSGNSRRRERGHRQGAGIPSCRRLYPAGTGRAQRGKRRGRRRCTARQRHTRTAPPLPHHRAYRRKLSPGCGSPLREPAPMPKHGRERRLRLRLPVRQTLSGCRSR